MSAERGLLLATMISLAGCGAASRPPLETVDYVDLNRFMGDWYVIAAIPTWLEREAHNAVESYVLDSNGVVQTTFTFRKGGPEGELKRYMPRGYVRDRETNATWGMQFIWPNKADYRIIYLNDDYSQTVIGRQKRDYVWIMARTSAINDEDYRKILAFIGEVGYDVSKIKRVPQRW